MRSGRRGRPRGTGIDRAPQHLPLPLGDLAAVHQPRRPHRWRERAQRRWRGMAVVIGVASAIAGAALSLTRPPVAVFAVGDSVHVGTSVLRAAAGHPDEYHGDAVLILDRRGDGTIRAAASTVAGGARMGSVCVMGPVVAASMEEHCSFQSDSRRFESVDRFTVAGDGCWHRTYDDGQEVRIAVPTDGAVVPVPFAIGR